MVGSFEGTGANEETRQTRIPEKWRPGAFDLWGQSHQIFHILIAVGLTIHFSAFAKAFNYEHTIKKC